MVLFVVSPAEESDVHGCSKVFPWLFVSYKI